MRSFRAVAYLFVIALFFTAPVAAQFDGGGNMFENTVVEWANNISAMEINSTADFVIFIVLPFIGMYGLFWFLIRKALLLTEHNFGQNTGLGSTGELSDTGKKASSLMAAAMATLFIFAYGGLTVPFALIIGLLGGLFLLWQLLGAARAGIGGLGGGGGNGGGPPGGNGGNGTQDVNVDVDTSDLENQMEQMNQNINQMQQMIGDLDIDLPENWPPAPGPGPGPARGRNAIPPMVGMMQQQQQMSPAMMQFMAFMMGEIYRQNNTIRIPPEGDAPAAELPVEVVNEFGDVMNDLDQNMVNETMVEAISELLKQNQQLNQEMLEEVFEFLREYEQEPRQAINNVEEYVEGDRYVQNVQNKQIVREVRQSQVLNNLVNEIRNEQRFNQINQSLLKQVVAILDGDVQIQGDTATVQVPGDQNVQVEAEVVQMLYQDILNLGSQQMEPFLNRLHALLMDARNAQQVNRQILVEIGEMLEDILKGGGEPEEIEDDGTFDDQLIKDIEQIIQGLRKEEELEEEVFRKKQDAEQELADALKELMNNHEGVFRALIYFRKVDMDAPQAEKHQQVEKILKNLNEIGSADHLQREVEEAERLIKEIEHALQEVRDADQKMSKDMEMEKSSDTQLEEVSRIVNEIQNGETKLREYVEKYENL